MEMLHWRVAGSRSKAVEGGTVEFLQLSVSGIAAKDRMDALVWVRRHSMEAERLAWAKVHVSSEGFVPGWAAGRQGVSGAVVAGSVHCWGSSDAVYSRANIQRNETAESETGGDMAEPRSLW